MFRLRILGAVAGLSAAAVLVAGPVMSAQAAGPVERQ